MKVAIINVITELIPQEGTDYVNKIYMIGVKVNNEETKIFTYIKTEYSNGDLQKALDLINSCDLCVGHNLIKYHKPIIENNIGKISIPIEDTLIDTKIMYSKDELLEIDNSIKDFPISLKGTYELSAFGNRIGNYKKNYQDFSKITKEMSEYCLQNVDTTQKLYYFLIKQPEYPNNSIKELEYKVAEIILKQQNFGFYFDYENARQLYTKMKFKKMNIEHSLKRVFKPKLLPDGEPKKYDRSMVRKKYVENKDYKFKSRIPYRFIHQLPRNKKRKYIMPSKNKFKWFDKPMKAVETLHVGAYQPLKYTKFNPGSREHIIKWLKDMYNWQPTVFTPSFNPKIDYDTLNNLNYEEAKLLKDYLKLVKDIGHLAEGDNSLIKMYSHNTHRFHGLVDTLGANTGRMTHSKPNITQVPKTEDFRKLLTVPSGRVLIDVDADQLELVMLGHYLSKYDNYAYAKSVDNGNKELGTDIHTINMKTTGLKTRDEAKTFIYSWLYGSGTTRIGYELWDYTNEPEFEYTEQEYIKAKNQILSRSVDIENKLYYPISKDKYIQFNETLILQTIYGQQVSNNFLEKTKGLKELIKDTQEEAKSGYIEGLDGRKLYVRSQHSALNLKLQAGGAIFMKKYLYEIDKKLYPNLINYKDSGYVANIHDAVNIETTADKSKIISNILEEGFETASKALNMRYYVKGKPKTSTNQWKTH